jgi:hypothetical protein
MGKDKHKQFIEVVRRELDGKIDGKTEYLDIKIDNRVSSSTFRWTVGIVIVVLVSTIGALFAYSSIIHDKVDNISERVTIIETKISEREK